MKKGTWILIILLIVIGIAIYFWLNSTGVAPAIANSIPQPPPLPS